MSARSSRECFVEQPLEHSHCALVRFRQSNQSCQSERPCSCNGESIFYIQRACYPFISWLPEKKGMYSKIRLNQCIVIYIGG